MAAWTGRQGDRGAVGDPQRHPNPSMEPGRRASRRDWAAPPPWAVDEEPIGPAPARPSSAIPGWTGGRDVDPRQPQAGDAQADRSRGLAGSDLEFLAGPDPAGPPARPVGAYLPDDLPSSPSGELPRRGPGVRPPIDPGVRHAAGLQGREPMESRDAHEPRSAADLFGPAWEQPRKFDAYPSLRTRVGLPSFAGIPPVAVGALALVVAALVLFFVAPMLLGIGGKDPNTALPTPVPTVAATPTPLPTETPGPTPTVYTVAKGDTATRIAAKFGITVAQLLAANPQIKNADKIKIGDQLVIPVPIATEVSGVEDASASP